MKTIYSHIGKYVIQETHPVLMLPTYLHKSKLIVYWLHIRPSRDAIFRC
jgi:hypothetical protein